MNEKIKVLKQKANRLPLTPGVYIMKDKTGKIIYIGKAKALKNRVTQYFGKGTAHTDKVRRMVENVDDFSYILCDSEFEALILENSLIKEHKPKYNILLKDDKGYHYIKITNERWPKLVSAMQKYDDGAKYIGPYYSSFVVKDTVDEVRKIFMLPDCTRSFDKYSKPCLNYHIGLCDAPCRAKQTREQYLDTLNQAVKFIKNGNREITDILREKMEKAAEKLDFEYAAKLRDRIKAVEKTGDKQKVVMCTYSREDVFSSAISENGAAVGVLVIKNRRLCDKIVYTFDGVTEKGELYSQVISQYYSEREDIPPRILVDFEIEDKPLLTKMLTEKAGKKVEIIKPERGEQKRLSEMCRKNAADHLAQIKNRATREMTALNELSVLLGLPQIPRIIESYDISNTAGDENVGAMVTFVDGKPYKRNYKLFKIKSFVGQDDYRSMAEVLDRRFTEYEKGAGEGFSTLPDLILLDGGKGQISAVQPIFEKHKIDVPLFGMVKDGKHRTRAVTGGGGDIAIKANRSAYTLITSIQDEVHRFAITYHKNRRSKKMLGRTLTKIEGIGDKKADALLRRFKTVKAVSEATAEELIAVEGITEKLARNIILYFKN